MRKIIKKFDKRFHVAEIEQAAISYISKLLAGHFIDRVCCGSSKVRFHEVISIPDSPPSGPGRSRDTLSLKAMAVTFASVIIAETKVEAGVPSSGRAAQEPHDRCQCHWDLAACPRRFSV